MTKEKKGPKHKKQSATSPTQVEATKRGGNVDWNNANPKQKRRRVNRSIERYNKMDIGTGMTGTEEQKRIENDPNI